MRPVLDRRRSQTPYEQGLSIVPYLFQYQRLHRDRWARGILAAGALLFVGWVLKRR